MPDDMVLQDIIVSLKTGDLPQIYIRQGNNELYLTVSQWNALKKDVRDKLEKIHAA